MTKNLLYFLSPHHNRSAIAEAWAKKSNLANWQITSSGWSHVKRDPLSVKAMYEVNIDLTKKPTNQLNQTLLKEADWIIAIYDFNNETCPTISPPLKRKLVQWNIPAPLKTSLTDIGKWVKYQEVCDAIAENVKELELSLKPPH